MMKRIGLRSVVGLLIVLELLSVLFIAPAQADETVRLGFLNGIRRELSRAEVRTTLDLWAQELAAKFGVPVKVYYYDDIRDLRRDFLDLKINGINVDAMALARNFSPDELAEGYSVAMPGGWNLQLIAASDGPIQGLADLKGKRVALLQGDATSALFLERICLQQYKTDCRHVFSEMQTVPTDNQAVMRVYFGQADLVLVYHYGYKLSVEMNPQLKTRVGRVIAELPISSLYYAFFSPRVDPAFRQKTLRIVPTLHQYPRGRQLLDMFKMDHLELAQPSELAPFSQLAREVAELKLKVAASNGHGGRK